MNGGVGLDIVLVGVGLQAVATQGRDDTLGYRVPETQRITDGQYHVTDPRRIGISQLYGLQLGQFDLEDGQVGGRVRADHHRVGRAPVVQQHLDGVGAGNNMVVGQDMSLVRHDYPRTQGLFYALALGLLSGLHEAAEKAVLQHGVGPGRNQFGGIDIDNGGGGPAHGFGVADDLHRGAGALLRQNPAIQDQQGCQQTGQRWPGVEFQALHAWARRLPSGPGRVDVLLRGRRLFALYAKLLGQHALGIGRGFGRVIQWRPHIRQLGRNFAAVRGISQLSQRHRPPAMAESIRAPGQVIVHVAVLFRELVKQFGGIGEVLNHLVLVGLLVLQQLVQPALGLALPERGGGGAPAQQHAQAYAQQEQEGAARDQYGQVVLRRFHRRVLLNRLIKRGASITPWARHCKRQGAGRGLAAPVVRARIANGRACG